MITITKKTENKNFDFVAIGDIVIDAFINLKAARVREEKGHPELCLSFADKIPYEKVDVIPAVGNSANASVSASRLGLKSALVTNVGADGDGRKCQEVLRDENVTTDFVKIHPDQKTNYHFVLLYQADRTILVKHAEFDYHLPNIGEPQWVYLSSLAENSLPFHQKIAKYLEENPEVKMAFQPGTFQMELGYEKLKNIYERTEMFFCNVQEAKRILGEAQPMILNECLKSDKKKTIIALLNEMKKLGPKIVIITDGPDGAYAYDGEKILFVPMYPDEKQPLDRTGAGDAFSSTVTSALASGKSLGEALLWGPINSMSVVQYVGAQKGLLTREKLEEFLKNAPESYKVSEIQP
jgi:ribokinase